MTNTQTIANQFGDFEPPSAEIQAEIERLSRQPYLELERVKNCHSWMYELLMSKSTGLLVGDSRSGKTVASKSFAERYNKIKSGKEFKQMVAIWERDVLQLPESSNLTKGKLFRDLKTATKKLVGRLDFLHEYEISSF